MIGAMVAFSVIGALAPSGLPPLAIVLVAGGCAIPVCMLVGYAMERAAYRPLRGAPRLAPLITRDRRVDHPAAPGDDDLEPQPARLSADHQGGVVPLCRATITACRSPFWRSRLR